MHTLTHFHTQIDTHLPRHHTSIEQTAFTCMVFVGSTLEKNGKDSVEFHSMQIVTAFQDHAFWHKSAFVFLSAPVKPVATVMECISEDEDVLMMEEKRLLWHRDPQVDEHKQTRFLFQFCCELFKASMTELHTCSSRVLPRVALCVCQIFLLNAICQVYQLISSGCL